MNFQKPAWGEGSDTEINMTPLIDAMFLLVIFFAVSTTFRVYPGISVNLPTAGSEQIKQEELTLTVVLTEGGTIFLEGEKVSRRHLVRVLKDKQRTASVVMFILQADSKARHGDVVEVMDAAKQAGISRLAIATRKKRGEPPGKTDKKKEAGKENNKP